MRVSTVLMLGCLAAVPRDALAQASPLLDPRIQEALAQEISGDISFEHIRWFTHYHRPMGGSEGFEAVARYVEQKAREYNLEDVRTITMATKTPSWTAQLGELWLTAHTPRRLAFTPEVALSLADYSRPTDIASAELVDVGTGLAAGDYMGRDVKGKVVLATGSLSTVMREAVWERGALGIVWFTMTRRDFQDQVPWTRIPVQNTDKTRDGTFAFVLSQREGLRLRAELAAAKGTAFTVRARVQSTLTSPGSQAIVEAVIRGSEIHDQDIVLTGHLQEERFSANDDASGCANVLEIARALKRMIDDGRLPRPTRDIRFWWVDEISAEENYFGRHPEERAQLLVNINQDMVGAKQSVGSRVQFVTRPPDSHASFLGDVVSSMVEAMVQGNTAYLAAGMARQLKQGASDVSGGSVALEEMPFTRPILARLGTREHYDARVIPFHNSTDHQVFNAAIVGVPGVTFTNWPDDYIHSSDDDLWQMDATQLERNALAVAASAWYLGTAGDGEAPALLTYMHGRGVERIGRDFATAAALISSAPAADRVDAWRRALVLVRGATARERRALESVARIASGAGIDGMVAALAADLDDAQAIESRLQLYWRPSGGPVPQVTQSDVERKADARIPMLVDNVESFFEKVDKLDRPKTLHSLMAYEALNFVDGRRSLLEIAHATQAEADSAGEWYYGRVALADVVSYLESAERAGLVTMRERKAISSR